MADTMIRPARTHKKCEACGGRGYIELGAGLAVLQSRYPELPIREMADRGWLGAPDEDDERSCDIAFLTFWDAGSHAEVRERWHA